MGKGIEGASSLSPFGSFSNPTLNTSNRLKTTQNNKNYEANGRNESKREENMLIPFKG